MIQVDYRIAVTQSVSYSREGRGAPQNHNHTTEPSKERRPSQETLMIYNKYAPPPILQTMSSGRQTNPDIQDIITGIVKLLNGNVNVAANTVRPLRPIQATR